ncbi:hypothetical protein LINGRAHAP2_LOCUS22782, partial [Linum grandiflorum]
IRVTKNPAPSPRFPDPALIFLRFSKNPSCSLCLLGLQTVVTLYYYQSINHRQLSKPNVIIYSPTVDDCTLQGFNSSHTTLVPMFSIDGFVDT